MHKGVMFLAGSLLLAIAGARGAELQAGPWPVGFTVLEERDGGRPLQIAVWYPAAGTGRRPLTYGDYFRLTASELPRNGRPKDLERKAIAGFKAFLASAGVTKADAASLLGSRMSAVRGAARAPGHFPVALIAQGNGQSAHDQAFLAEFLAGNGYVVATIPSATRLSGPMKSEEDIPAKAEEQAAGLAFALRRLGRWENARPGAFGLIGHSFGARSSLLLAMSDREAAGIVSLDGGIGNATGKGMLERSRLFDAKRAAVPIVHFFEDADPRVSPDLALLRSLSRAERFLVKVAHMRHAHFTTLGAFASGLPSLAKATSAEEGTRRAYDAVCRTTLSFLDTFVKDSGAAKRGRFEPSDPDFLTVERLPATEPSGASKKF